MQTIGTGISFFTSGILTENLVIGRAIRNIEDRSEQQKYRRLIQQRNKLKPCPKVHIAGRKARIEHNYIIRKNPW